MVRYNPDGSTDADFGDAGRVKIVSANYRRTLPVDHVRGRVVEYNDHDGVITITRYWL